MDGATRAGANEESVRHFFAAWDPAWRWILILGMRELRRDPVQLGNLAAAEANSNETWAEDTYAYGPLSLGVTASAVNEAAQHCEDLFALLRFLRERSYFAKEMAAYSAGKVVDFGRRLAEADDDSISRLFLVPDRATVARGMAEAIDPEASIAGVEAGRALLGEMVRATAVFYRKYEDFHVQYKHGLKLPLRPFGVPTDEAIEQRKTNVKAPVFVYTNEPISAMMRRPAAEHGMMMNAGPLQQGDVSKLVKERNLLRLRMAHEVDLDDIVDASYTVVRLLQLAATNRLALGEIVDGNQGFSLPAPGKWERTDVLLRVAAPLRLEDFAEPKSKRARRT